MNKALSLNRRGWAKVWRFSILALLLFPALLLTPGESFAVNPATPLELSGLTPLWQENFTNGSIERMQYAWFQGSATAVTSFVQPGAVFLGRDGGCPSPLPDPCEAEQEINNFKMAAGESLPHTFEFDVYSPQTGRGRVSARPSRWGDMTTVLLGLNSNGRTELKFGQDNQTIVLSEQTGPTYNGGWTHVVISYVQDHDAGAPCLGALCAHFVVAINEEINQVNRLSELTPGPYADWADEWANDPGADGWSIEHTSDLVQFGKYIANLRFYSGFYTSAELSSRLPVGTVDTYLASLPNPTTYTGPKKEFQDPTDPFDPLGPTGPDYGPRAKAYATQVGPSTSKTFDFDGSLSSDWDKLTAYAWDFGDGIMGSGRLPSHTYASAGTYDVILTVIHGTGTDSHTIQVTIAGTPPPMPFKLFLPMVVK